MSHITVKDFLEENREKFHFEVLTGEKVLNKKKIIVSDINRPGLALSGYFGYFPFERVQVFGKTEFSYLKKLGREKAEKVLEQIFKKNIPCIIISRELKPPYNFLVLAEKYKTPVFGTSMYTTQIISASMIYLEKKLAPKKTIHGTFVDVYGVGVMLMGKSGIGKSEISLELIKRGHRLIADDLIEITRLNDEQLIGKGMSVVQHHMEIRGVGIIDIKNLFGIGAIREFQEVELILRLEEWEKNKDYERLGLDVKTEELLDVKIPNIILPVKP
ncbi:MAG: HPr(Ser) kinase/phosphatase, partial [bacterium]